MSGDVSRFRLECSECNVEYESDDFDQVSRFHSEHEKHTDHLMEFVEADFDFEIGHESEWVLLCSNCEKEWAFDSREAAVDFREEHARYTDHAIDMNPKRRAIELDGVEFDIEESLPVKSLIRKLQSHYDDGVPREAVLAHVQGDSNAIAEALHELQKLKARGDVYEPKTDRLRIV